MAQRLYLQNNTAPYSPATLRGAWDQTTGYVDKKMDIGMGGTFTTIGTAETSLTNLFDVLLARFVSMPITQDMTISGTVNWVFGVLESSLSANDFFHVHIYVTTGDSDTVRGTLLTDSIGATEWPSTAKGATEGNKTLTNVTATKGDRIVMEVGYQAQNTSATSFTGTMNYGGNAPDLVNANTGVTSYVGWLEFSQTIFYKFIPLKPKPIIAIVDKAHPLARKLIADVPFTEGGGSVARDRATKKIAGTITTATWTKRRAGAVLSFGANNDTLTLGTKVPILTGSKYFTVVTILSFAVVDGSIKQIFHFQGGTQEFGVETDFDSTSSGLNRLNFFIENASAAYFNAKYSPGFNANEEHMIFFTYDGANMSIYIDDDTTAKVSTAISSIGADAAATYNIGKNTVQARALNGTYSLFRYYNRVLTARERVATFRDPWQIYKRGQPILGKVPGLNRLNRIVNINQAVNRAATY